MMGSVNKTNAINVRFTYCKNFASAETKSATWASFANTVTKSVGYDTKEESIKRAAIVGGVRDDENTGRADNVKTREILTLDYDDFAGISINDIVFALEMNMPHCSWVAYSTFRHTLETPRIRIMAPLSRRVGAAEYSALVGAVADALDIGAPDDCSMVMNQIMFLASHRNGVEPWSASGGDGVLDVDAMNLVFSAVDADVEAAFDLDLAIAAEPLDLSDDQVSALLESYSAEALDYDGWMRVGMALWHQHRGSDSGLVVWDAWCQKDAERYKQGETNRKWASFGGRSNPVTMASVIKAAGGIKGGAMTIDAGSDVAKSLQDEAETISDMDGYKSFKKRIQKMSAIQMPPDVRSMMASIVHEVFAKAVGMGLREVKSAFKPMMAMAQGEVGEVTSIGSPEWLVDWVYDESNCLFVNSNIANYGIKREAFCAKFNRMPECTIHETDAARLALDMVHIPTVANTVYWPSQDRLFNANGRDCLNTYFESGADILPAGALESDDDGQAVVQLFLDHVAFLIEDEREQGIFLDWLSYVYQNAGKRVHWAMLLWGIEGNGKSYFFKIMEMLMGENTKPISTSMIESRFNDWAVGSVLSCIEEIRISGTNKWAILDTVKPMLTNDTIGVEPKGRASYSAPNHASYLMLTNHQDAIPVSNNERRYCVIFTRHRCEQDLFDELGGRSGVSDYFKKLFSESTRRIDAIGRWLMDREQSASFDAGGRAPNTNGMAEMRDANVSDDDAALKEAISDFACDVVSKNLIDITYLNDRVMMDGNMDMPKNRKLAMILRSLGLRPTEARVVMIKGKKHYIWVKPNKITDDEAKRTVRKFHLAADEFAEVPF